MGNGTKKEISDDNDKKVKRIGGTRVLLDSKIIRNLDIDNKEFFAYVALRALSAVTITISNKHYERYYVSTKQLAFLFFKSCDEKIVKILRDGIRKLCARFQVQYEYTNGDFITDLSLFWVRIGQVFFTQTHLEDFVAISATKTNTLGLMRYYCILMSTFSRPCKKSLIGSTPIDGLAKLSSLSVKTVNRMNAQLSDMNIIRIYKHRFSSTGFSSNIYTQVRTDTGLVSDDELKTIAERNAHEIIVGDSNRRLAQIYIRLCKGLWDNYTENDIRQTYSFCISQNEHWKNQYELTKSEYCLSKIRDMSIFDNFVFLFENI